jgi:LuxR family transcriptional regulator of csgAB operon
MANVIDSHTAAKWYQTEYLKDVPASSRGEPSGPKMILVDTHMLDRDALSRLFLSRSWKNHSHNLMALFNLQHEYQIEKEALKNGVRGFLYDTDSVEDLISGICAINSGELWISRRIMSQCLQENYIGKDLPVAASHSLSVREIEILRVLVAGASNDLIADRMCISHHTVKTHLHNIFKKIGVTNRLQAVLWAKENL